MAKVSGKVKVESDFVEGQRKCLQTSKVEIYYFMSSVTAQNKFLAGTFFLSSNYKISYSYLKRKIKKLSYCVNSYCK